MPDPTEDTDLPRSRSGDCARHVPPPPTSAPVVTAPFRVETLDLGGRPGRCVVVEDLDGDGRMDLAALVRDGSVPEPWRFAVLWGTEGDFEPDAWPIPLGTGRAMDGCTLADLDDDGRLDLLFGTGDDVSAFRLGPGRTATWTPGVVPLASALGPGLATPDHLVVADLDGEGPPDLLVGLKGRLGTCSAAEEDPGGGVDVVVPDDGGIPGPTLCFTGTEAGFVPTEGGLCAGPVGQVSTVHPYVPVLADLNDDRRPDVYYGTDFAENVFMISDEVGYRDLSSASGLGGRDNAMGATFLDVDGDGLRDLYVSDIGPDQLFLADDCAVFYESGLATGVALATDRTVTWGVAALDVELDGDLDLYVASSLEVEPGGFAEPLCGFAERALPLPPDLLLVNDGTGHFTRVDVDAAALLSGYGSFEEAQVATGDLDGDGDPDVVRASYRGVQVLWNEAPHAGHWLAVDPRDAAGRPAIGARVVVVHPDGGRRRLDLYPGYGTSGWSDARAWFGLGPEPGPVRVRVTWPDGEVATIEEAAVDRVIVVGRPAGGGGERWRGLRNRPN